MELVFVHGWGCDAGFWDPLAALLSEYKQQRMDRGYFGYPPTKIETQGPAILIGHSLGFVYGLQQKQDWAGWVAINGFSRFVQSSDGSGCVHGFLLGEMRRRFNRDPQKTLADFYQLIGAPAPAETSQLNQALLLEGLDELRDCDVQHIPAVPGLVLASRSDPLVPMRASEGLIAHNPLAKLEWHEGGGHLLPQTDAAWCAGKMRDFIASLG